MNINQLKAQCDTYAIASRMKAQGYPLYMAVHLLARKAA